MPAVTETPTPAAVAWVMMSRRYHRMPVAAALDWLRTRMDTDDLAAVKSALYAAAADDLDRWYLKGHGTRVFNITIPAFLAGLRSGSLATEGDGWGLRYLNFVHHDRAYDTRRFHRRCFLAVELCRAVRDLPE